MVRLTWKLGNWLACVHKLWHIPRWTWNRNSFVLSPLPLLNSQIVINTMAWGPILSEALHKCGLQDAFLVWLYLDSTSVGDWKFCDLKDLGLVWNGGNSLCPYCGRCFCRILVGQTSSVCSLSPTRIDFLFRRRIGSEGATAGFCGSDAAASSSILSIGSTTTTKRNGKCGIWYSIYSASWHLP